jgi:hypothetical protein
MTHSPIKISLRHLNEKIKHFFIRTKNFIRISEAETGRSKPADQNRQIKTGRSKPADQNRQIKTGRSKPADQNRQIKTGRSSGAYS